METISIVNTILILGILLFLIKKHCVLYIYVNRTFWMKKIYSVTLMRITHKNEYVTAASGIFTIKIRNYKKASEWDSEQFKNGNYKKLTNLNQQQNGK